MYLRYCGYKAMEWICCDIYLMYTSHVSDYTLLLSEVFRVYIYIYIYRY